jgi:hypothetical protein
MLIGGWQGWWPCQGSTSDMSTMHAPSHPFTSSPVDSTIHVKGSYPILDTWWCSRWRWLWRSARWHQVYACGILCELLCTMILHDIVALLMLKKSSSCWWRLSCLYGSSSRWCNLRREATHMSSISSLVVIVHGVGTTRWCRQCRSWQWQEQRVIRWTLLEPELMTITTRDQQADKFHFLGSRYISAGLVEPKTINVDLYNCPYPFIFASTCPIKLATSFNLDICGSKFKFWKKLILY